MALVQKKKTQLWKTFNFGYRAGYLTPLIFKILVLALSEFLYWAVLTQITPSPTHNLQPNKTFWAIALERKWVHTEKETKISDPGGIWTHDLRNKSPLLSIYTPSTRSRVFLITETFSPNTEYGDHPHVTGDFGYRKWQFSNTLFGVETFENGDLSCLCGRANTEVLKYDDVLPRLLHIRFENATCGCNFFFKYGEKNLYFPKNPATCGRSNTIRKRYV